MLRRAAGATRSALWGRTMALPSCPLPLVPQFLLWSPPQRSCFSAQSFRQSSLRLNCSPRNKRPLGRGRMGAGSRISLTALRQAPREPLGLSARFPAPSRFSSVHQVQLKLESSLRSQPFLPVHTAASLVRYLQKGVGGTNVDFFPISIPQRSFAFSEKPYLKHHSSPCPLYRTTGLGSNF